MAKKYNETRQNVAVTTLGEDNKEQTEVQSNLTEKKAKAVLDEIQEKASKGETIQAEIVKAQTFEYVEAESLEEVATLVPNPVEALNIFNRGYILKQQSIIRDFMTDDDQAAVEGVYALQADAAEVRERRKADPKAKAAKALSELLGFSVDASTLDSVLTQFQQAAAQPTA